MGGLAVATAVVGYAPLRALRSQTLVILLLYRTTRNCYAYKYSTVRVRLLFLVTRVL